MSTVLPHEHGDGKIQGWHRDRLAVSYVRQSSRQQVLDHGESTRLQYGLTGRAAALGWPASRVMVIDEDLGRSAANAAERPGFARLAAEITMGHVGLVLGLEMSRLARAGRDWHQLIELCSLAGALLADADGVYDPNWYNDRLLLGLKGTMTEALCRYPDNASLGSPFSRSKLRPWLRSVAGCTTHARSASSRPGSAPMPTAWTTWSGSAGHTGSNAPGATALEAGGRVIAGSCAPPAGTGPR